jgi:hypothetical protein
MSSSEEKSITITKITCEGCLYDHPNQLAHMDFGGCLYDFEKTIQNNTNKQHYQDKVIFLSRNK